MRQGTHEEEVLQFSASTLLFRAGEVLGGENGGIGGAVLKQTGDKERQALEAGEIQIKEGIEFIEDMLMNHPDFPGRYLECESFLISDSK